MRIPLRELLSSGDREHVRNILETRTRSTLADLLRDRTFVEEQAATAFQALPASERERLLSELIWRATCFLDGSHTATAGMNCYELSNLFSALLSEEVDGAVCTLVLNDPAG